MANPFLSNLGVKLFDQARTPLASTFPPAFNPNNASVWSAAVQALVPTADPASDWALTIKNYVFICEQRAVYPFQNFHESRNDQISDYLRTRRRLVVKFINNSGIFKDIKIQNTIRKVVVTDSGFVLTVQAKVTIKDPTFSAWLTKSPMPRFNIKDPKSETYIKSLDSGLNMFVYNEGVAMDARWHIGYEIMCPFYPDLPSNNVPSKAELERFILEILWMPHLRSVRPFNMMHRLI